MSKVRLILKPSEIEVMDILYKLFQDKRFICYEYLRNVYKGEYSFTTIARSVRKLRSYGLLEPIGTRRGCFKPTEKFYEVYEELIR